ncbi:MAG: antitoxin component YwqK of YwqJK toxin-antitoxin module [Roseivirga sp.]|jgi:antitoxin component YwqK of YwqJK toxin-antitoxin module
MQKLTLFIFILAIPLLLMGQTKKEKRAIAKAKAKAEEMAKPDISFKKEAPDTIADADLKVKRNYFYGEKTKRAYTVTDVQGRTQIEDFYILKEAVDVNSYVPLVAVYDKDKREIVNARNRGNQLESVLHGPYKRLVNEKIVEEGMYFFGTKHERWLSLSLQQRLNNKEHFFKGWYRDSEITYYDPDNKTKVKEVIPVQYGKKEGMYYYFYENGQLAVRGFYVFDKKVGVWEEFHNTNRTTLKKEIQFPPDPFQKQFRAFVRKEWDRFANPIYESAKLKNGF